MKRVGAVGGYIREGGRQAIRAAIRYKTDPS